MTGQFLGVTVGGVSILEPQTHVGCERKGSLENQSLLPEKGEEMKTESTLKKISKLRICTIKKMFLGFLHMATAVKLKFNVYFPYLD